MTTTSAVTTDRKKPRGTRRQPEFEGLPKRKHKTDLRTALVFILPATIGLVMFFIVPTIRCT